MARLVSSDFDGLPTEPKARWLAIREILEMRLDQAEEFEQGITVQDMMQYAYAVAEAAKTLGVGTLELPTPSSISEDFSEFRAKVGGLATHLSLRASHEQHLNSKLSSEVQERIRLQTARIRELIHGHNEDIRNSDKLLQMLDAFEKEIDGGSLDLSQAMRTLAFIAAGLGGTTAFLADAPQALATIQQTIGLQIAANEEQKAMLQFPNDPPTPSLPPMPKLLGPPADESKT
ncbi:MAG: hypothetical protein AAFQ60_17105 [Pseudomonadota bacterium]